MTPVLKVWAATDTGCVRQRNEDALCIGEQAHQSDRAWSGYAELGQEQPLLVAVIDGMGGHRGGALASRIVATGLAGATRGVVPSADAAHALINRVNRELYERMQCDPTVSGMGAALAALWFGDDGGVCINIGDAKVFREQDGFLHLRSEDHVVEPGAAQRLLSRSLGGSTALESVEPSVSVETLKPGRRYLLCSDGLTDELTLDQLECLMRLPAEQACGAMVEAARQAGGRDNITLALIEISSGSQA